MSTGNLDLKTVWGPFSPTYLGISHILDASIGSMADIAMFAGRSEPLSVVLPDSAFDYMQNIKTGERRADVGAVPEEVATDYSSYSMRYFLDGDTALARFKVESEELMRCEITFHNSSAKERKYFYGLGLTVSDAQRKVRLKNFLRPWWIAARDYTEIEAYQKVFGLGCRQCLTRVFNWCVESETLAQAFGGWVGDRVKYRKSLLKPMRNGHVYLRYIKYGIVSQTWELRINGRAITFSFPQTWAIPGGGWGKNRDAYEEWKLLRIPIGCVPETDLTVELQPVDAPGNDQARIWLDGMLFSDGLVSGDEGRENLLHTSLVDELLQENARVELETSSGSASKFRIMIQNEQDRHITVVTEGMKNLAQNGKGSFIAHLRKRFDLPPARMKRDSTVCPWGALDSEAILVPSESERTVCFTVAFDSARNNSPEVIPEQRLGSDFAKKLRQDTQVSPSIPTHSSNMEGFACQNRSLSSAITSTRRVKSSLPSCKNVQQNAPYAEMIARLRDVLLFNVNYSLQLFGSPSPYYVPSKYFPLPYSWDGGFTAVGLASFAPDLALQQACYFMADAELDFPCLYCGSPVPTPLYALWDIYQAKQDLAALSGAYAGTKRMYDFYLGRTPGSVVNADNNGLLSTYPYCYNLGIDDHPIQRWAEECHLTKKGLYSLILMAQILRIARIMRNIAHLLELEADAEQYRKDAELLAGIVDGQMWDEKSGLYGWLCKTDQGVDPVFFDGCAGDRTACAFLPLFAGQTVHKERLIQQMMDPARFNTPFGVSSVDMQAPSYNPKGYWNGGIWPVMQWYLWRGLLESGEPALARKIAETILGTWSRCFEKEHYLGEHFMITSAQMNGAANFGGLSAILIPMHAAYFSAYQITTCYDVVIRSQSADQALDTLYFQISAPFLTASSHDLLINMGKGRTRYDLIVNGKPFGEFVSDEFGHMTIRLPRPTGMDNVLVKPAVPGRGTGQ